MELHKNRTDAYRGTFDLNDENDLHTIKEIRLYLKSVNRVTGSKLYLKLQGRGSDRKAKAKAAGLSTYNVNQCLPLSIADKADAYVYDRN